MGIGQDADLAHTSLPACGFAEGLTATVAAVFLEGVHNRFLLDQLVSCEVNALEVVAMFWDLDDTHEYRIYFVTGCFYQS